MALLFQSAEPAFSPGDSGLARLARQFGVAGVGVASATAGWIEAAGAGRPAVPLLGTSRGCGIVRQEPGAPTPFVLTVPIAALWGGPEYWLVLWDEHSLDPAKANALLARATEFAAQVALDRILAAEQYRSRLFERASATARIGIWACRLPSEILSWSTGVYDLFELPHGTPVTRALTLDMYTPDSRRRMEAVRRHAIETKSDFAFDAEIITAKGNHRWVRITAAVESRGQDAVSIFGMKQDITEEKNLADHTRRLAETDVMTGLANRSLFQQRLDVLDTVVGTSSGAALLLVDLDKFKLINDTYGHAIGDACLVETARRLRAICPPEAVVARIGGDEFAVLTKETEALDPENLAQDIVEALKPPFLLGEERRQVGASVGLALHVGQSADMLYRNADTALYAAKSGGRSTWRRFAAQ